MLVPGSVNPLLLTSAAGAAAGGISRSIRLNAPDSAYLSRTPASAGTSYTTWTWSQWVKRSALGSGQVLFSAGVNTDDYLIFNFEPNDTLRLVTGENGSTNQNLFTTAAVFRDPSAWYHIVLQSDTTNATQADRWKIYVNGVRQTVSGTIAAQNYAGTTFNRSGVAHNIGRQGNGVAYFNGYLADIYFIDGQALTPSSFTETDATTGQLIPKAFTGSYGTNGFHLEFSDNSGTTSTTLGKDSAGSNNWTPNNFSVSSGAGNDSLVDVPTSSGTDSGLGGEVRGNYCTWNPLNISGPTLSNGNLDVTTPSANYGLTYGTFGVSSGKWYWEITPTATAGAAEIGIAKAGATLTSAVGAYASGYSYVSSALKGNNNSYSSYGASYTANDVIGVALDLDAGTLVFYKNGSSQGTAYSSLTGEFFPVVSDSSNSNGSTFVANFGQRPFAYTAPSGFKALNTANLPAPAVVKSNTVMDVKLYTGNGSTQAITGLGFSPDFVWTKQRNTSRPHAWLDVVRGGSKLIGSDLTYAEETASDLITSFDSNGYTLGADATHNRVNASGGSYVAWAWDAGSSTVTNTQGSITGGSQVRANPSAGFSIVTYTGATSSTVGHGLGVAPGLIILKQRDNAANWPVYHSSLGVSSVPLLDSTTAPLSLSNYWGSSVTSTTFGTASNGAYANAFGSIVAYCFAPVVGYSNGFSFSGSGSADGPFCFLGFRPRLILLKRSDSTGNWILLDTAREGYNVDNDPLWPNLADAEGTADLIDITSNGFKVRSTDASVNASGGTYIGFAWAESPFNYARAR